MKNLILLLALLIAAASLSGCKKENKETSEPEEVFESTAKKMLTEEELKQMIDSASIKVYKEKRYGVMAPYPDFFEVDTTSSPSAGRFNYPFIADDSINLSTGIGIVMFVEENIEKWNIKEAVQNLEDSATVCLGHGKDYFILSSYMENYPIIHSIEKCFLVNGNWINYTLYYDIRYENAVERLIKMVKEWQPWVKE